MNMPAGYRERTGVFEVVVADNEISSAIQAGVPEDELRLIIAGTGTHSLAADALAKVRDGITSFEEAESIGRTR